MKHLLSAAFIVLLAGCTIATKPTEPTFEHLNLQSGVLTSEKWQSFKRFPPMYPIQEARSGTQGCATIEYVILPSLEVTGIKVIDSSNERFSSESAKVVQKWKWSQLPEGIIDAPIRTQTRFEFCLEDGKGMCSNDRLLSNTECRGMDLIPAVGFKMN